MGLSIGEFTEDTVNKMVSKECYKMSAKDGPTREQFTACKCAKQIKALNRGEQIEVSNDTSIYADECEPFQNKWLAENDYSRALTKGTHHFTEAEGIP